MTVALALLAGALLVAALIPRLWWRLHHTRTDPLLLIAAWTLSIVGFLATGVAAVVVLLLPNNGMPEGLVHAVRGCWTMLRHGEAPHAEQVAGLAGMIVLAVLGVRLALIGRRQAALRRGARDERLAILRVAGRHDAEDPTTVWLAHDRPLAFSLAGRPGLIVATDGLADHLTPRELTAVLEHERAHLRGRHHLLLAAAETVAGTLPFLPLAQQAPTALRDLVELAADTSAAQQCGPRVLRDALSRVADPNIRPTALAVGNHAIDTRLRRLAQHTPTPGRVRRVLRWGAVATASITAPACVASAVFLLAAAFCAIA